LQQCENLGLTKQYSNVRLSRDCAREGRITRRSMIIDDDVIH